VSAAGRPARDRACGRKRDEQDDEHPQQHQEKVPEAQRSTVLALCPGEVARGGKLDTRADASAEEVQQQRHGRGTGESEPQRCEKAHGSS
jgi:hypothetical protein